MKLALWIILIVTLATNSPYVSVYAGTNQRVKEGNLSRIQRLYVGSMGRSDEAIRFRLLLQDQLTDKGFSVVDTVEKADAILKGALTVRVHDGSEARVYVALETPDGDRLWARDFGNGIFKNLFSLKEPVELRARDGASALRAARKR